MTGIVYLVIGGIYFCVLFRALQLFLLSKALVSERAVVYFAQHYSVFAVMLSVLAMVLSVWMVVCDVSAGPLGRLWAFFDLMVAVLLVAQLRHLQLSLMTGRRG